MRRAAALVLTMVLAVSACGDDGDGGATSAARSRASQVRAAARDAGLSSDVADLLADAAGVLDERFRVTYDLGGESGGTAVLTQDPPRRRVDLRAQVDGDEVTRTMITDGDRATACERTRGTWTCREGTPDDAATPGAFGSDEIENVVGDLETARDVYDFRVATRRLAGVEARCLVTELKPGKQPTEALGAKGTLCVAPEGVPLLVETPVASLRALTYTTNVDDDAFDPPAKVTT